MPELSLFTASTITPERFASVLEAAHSPCAGDAFTLYYLIESYKINPAGALAFFWHESKCGTEGFARETLSWGNMKNPEGRQVGWVGAFARYPSWRMGLDDWCDHIVKYYAKRGLTTVEKIIPVYAPSSDKNVPAAYINDVRAKVAQWQEIPPMAPAYMPNIITIKADYSNERTEPIQLIVAHGTAGRDSTNELQHGGGRKVSIHVLIKKSGQIIRMVEDDRAANHAGFGTISLHGTTYSPDKGHSSINAISLGFELENLQDGKDPYPDAQLLAMGWQISDWRTKHGPIPLVRHADVDPSRRADTVNLSVAQIEGWAARFQVQPPVALQTYRVKDPVSTKTDDNWLAVREGRDTRFPIALGGTCKLWPGTLVVLDDVADGWGHLVDNRGFVAMSGLEH